MNLYLFAEHGEILSGKTIVFLLGAILTITGSIKFIAQLVIQLKQKGQASRALVVGLIMLIVGIVCLVIGSSGW